jgi:hypothetical protein
VGEKYDLSGKWARMLDFGGEGDITTYRRSILGASDSRAKIKNHQSKTQLITKDRIQSSINVMPYLE